MYPIINLFGKELPTYALLALIGILAAGFYACLATKKRGYNDNDTIVIGLFAFLGAFIGAHILYGITNISDIIYYIRNFELIGSFSEFFSVFSSIFGGMVFYGGLIGGLIVGVIVIRKKNLPLADFSDIFAPAIPLFHTFGRIGCFFAGCCYGIESSWGFTAHGNEYSPGVNDVTRLPVQLFEAGCNLCIFLVLMTLFRKEKFRGKLMYLYLIIYSVVRFILEFLRGDEVRGFILGLSTSQFISILLLVFAISCLIIQAVKGSRRDTVMG